MEELQILTRKAFATSYGFLLVAECYHWNVEDPNFQQYHKLFGDIYDEIEGKLDKFAEEIRGIGAYVPATFKELSKLSSIVESEDTIQHTAPEMIKYLYYANNSVVSDLMNAYTAEEKDNKPGISSFLAKRIDKHHKHGWMLYASMKV